MLGNFESIFLGLIAYVLIIFVAESSIEYYIIKFQIKLDSLKEFQQELPFVFKFFIPSNHLELSDKDWKYALVGRIIPIFLLGIFLAVCLGLILRSNNVTDFSVNLFIFIILCISFYKALFFGHKLSEFRQDVKDQSNL